jgi:DNA-binding NarL/FixJ family response regulator
VVAISADDSQGAQYDMTRAGAVGYVVKGSPDEEIVRVIRSSACGDHSAALTSQSSG